ncbi:MAG: DMT family transporter [Peptococcaceae bacterium]|nr:DMT family transporter [Peptococcaceae bacterium]
MDNVKSDPAEMVSGKLFRNKVSVVILAIAASILWGSAFPVLKISFVIMHIDPGNLAAQLVLAGMRFLLASLLLFTLILLSNREVLKWQKGLGWKLTVLGVVQISMQYFFFYYGLNHTSGMKGAILSSSSTFFVVLMAHFIYTNDKLNRRKLLGLLTGLGGIILVNWGKNFSLDFTLVGEGFMLIAGLASAAGNLLGKRMAKDIDPILLTAGQLLMGSLVLLAAGLPGLKGGDMVFSTSAWLLLIYAAFISAIAFFLWYSLLKYNKAGEIVIYSFITPVAGAILSALLLPGERLSAAMLAGLVLVALGLVFVNRANSKKLSG